MKTLILLIFLTMCTSNTLLATNNNIAEYPRDEIVEILKEALKDQRNINYGYWTIHKRDDGNTVFYEVVATNKSNSMINVIARIKDKRAGEVWIEPGRSKIVFSSLDPFPANFVQCWAIPARSGDIW